MTGVAMRIACTTSLGFEDIRCGNVSSYPHLFVPTDEPPSLPSPMITFPSVVIVCISQLRHIRLVIFIIVSKSIYFTWSNIAKIRIHYSTLYHFVQLFEDQETTAKVILTLAILFRPHSYLCSILLSVSWQFGCSVPYTNRSVASIREQENIIQRFFPPWKHKTSHC